MRVNNNMNMVEPKIIESPISGQAVKPRLRTYIRGNQEIVEAEWIDPASGTFIRKGIVSIREITKPEQK